jgi:hypothetical protein
MHHPLLHPMIKIGNNMKKEFDFYEFAGVLLPGF